ncbi:hypothetical protein [Glycomyces buryatensis]|uniref:DUF4829 domain-containing protein n=1 Tax=Glycomyces buryatensis TaxID=2570927 RepID=A0A4S8QDH3_9ACTN|nr:hypothetical protein [Glycomyces buryatensis]THV42360.1 hypothetical protein FAB82_06805 [Glycomyces buryatensis]
MTDRPSPTRQPARSRRMTWDQAAMLVVTISVLAILGAMGFLGITVLPGELAEPAPEPLAADPAESGSDEPGPALEYSTTEEVDLDSREGAATLWFEARINDDLDALEPRTCANPSSVVTADLQDAEAHEARDDDYTVSNIFVTSREYNGDTEVAIFLLDQEPTYDYIWEKESRPGDIITILTVVEEDGEWKVCDVEGFA